MTAWQFEVGFVPSTALTRLRALSQPPAKIEEADRAGLWTGVTLPDSLVENLDKLSPDSCLLSPSQLRWGDGGASFIDVFVEGGRVTNISVSLDLRMPCLKFVSDLTLVANRFDWLVITTDGRVFRPTVRQFMVEIQHSPAMRWIRGSLDAFALRHPTRKNDVRDVTPAAICE